LQYALSGQGLHALVKSLLKLRSIGYVAYMPIDVEVERFMVLSARDVVFVGQYSGQSILYVCVRASHVMVVLAGLDYAWQHWQFEKNIRMGKQASKGQTKSQESDTQLKVHIHGIMRQTARKPYTA
jgi:flagellar biosynthetic protein FlhB